MSKFQRIYWSGKFDWKHYSLVYDKYCKTNKNYYIQSSNVLIKNTKLSNKSKVIDLCCGTGMLTAQLLKKFSNIKIFAIDLSEEMIYYYMKNFSDKIKSGQIKAIPGNAENIDRLVKEKYDVIFISSALWDLEIEVFIRNCYKILNKGGLIVFNLPALVVEKEKGFIFFIEHFFRQTLNNKMIYRRIGIDYLKKLFWKNKFKLVKIKEYSFNLSKLNIKCFFNLLRYRYPFILFPKKMPYNLKLKKCTEIFNESLKYVPKEGIDETGYVFVFKKK